MQTILVLMAAVSWKVVYRPMYECILHSGCTQNWYNINWRNAVYKRKYRFCNTVNDVMSNEVMK